MKITDTLNARIQTILSDTTDLDADSIAEVTDKIISVFRELYSESLMKDLK